MKWLLLCFLMIVVLRPCLPQEDQTKTHKTKDETSNASTSGQPTILPVIKPSITAPPTNQPSNNQTNTSPEDSMKPTDWLMVALTAIYVLISYFGLRAIKKQIKIAADSVQAAQDAAVAAKQSAQAAIDQIQMMKDRERARITLVIPSPSTPPDFRSPLRFTGGDENEEQFFMELPIAVQNHGPTKAFEVRARVAMKIQPKDSPFVIDTLKAIDIPDVIGEVIPNNPIHILVDDILTAKESDEVNAASSDFHVYGEIAYVDVFGDKRLTPFRFLWQVYLWEDGDDIEFSGRWVNESPKPT